MPVPLALGSAAPEEADPGGAVGATKTWRIWGLDFDARIVQTVAVCVLVLLLAYDNNFGRPEYGHFFFQALIPFTLVVLIWRESPRRYGLALGNWRLGLPVALGAIAIMAVVIWIVGHMPEFRVYYAALSDQRPAWRVVLDAGVDMFAWEFFFRGWLMWALARKYGTDAIWLQVIPFALMHVWKPEIEQLSTLFGGAVLGLLAWRTKSFLWGWLLHWFMMAWVLVVAAGYV